ARPAPPGRARAPPGRRPPRRARARARADLAVPAQLEAGPAPLAFALGADDVHRIGLPHALRPPVSTTPVRLDPAERPGLYYPVPDGDWQAFQHLMAHLHSADPARGRAAAGG
ncbi:DUF6177 family protein, partial [Streptomyces xiamenensis]